MDFEEFIKRLKADVEGFEKHWRTGMEKDKEMWPPTLPTGDWWEQFNAHCFADGSEFMKPLSRDKA